MFTCGLIISWTLGPDTNIRPGGQLVMAIISSSIAIISGLELLFKKWNNKFIRIIAYIFFIPLIPLLIIGLLSQTRLLASLTLPIIVLIILIPLSTFGYLQLELLELGDSFNTNVIPYLNLTTITVLFIYSDKYFVRFLTRYIPEKGMPQAVKDATFELLEKRPFIKIAYGFFVLLIIISTVERLSDLELFPFFDNYKNIALESLVTFVAIDQFLFKWKKQ